MLFKYIVSLMLGLDLVELLMIHFLPLCREVEACL